MNQLPIRPLGATEKLFWLLDQASPVHFVMAAELNGTVDELSLQKVLTALLDRHPLLSSRIIANGYLHPYFEHIAEATIPLEIIEQKHADTLTVEIAAQLSRPFYWNNAPLLRCVLIKDPFSPVIVFAAHHAVCDGISMTIIIRDVLRTLSGEKVKALPTSPSIDQLLGLVPENIPEATNFTPESPSPITRRRDNMPSVYIERIGPELSYRIVKRSKIEGTTFQGALCAAALTVARSAEFPWSSGEIKVVVPISVRKELTSEESSALYINSRTLVFRPGEAFDFWGLAREAKSKLSGVHDLATINSNAVSTRERMFSNVGVKQLSDALQKAIVREMMISNLGRITYPTSFGELKLKGIWGPVALSGTPNEVTIGVTTVDGQIGMTMATRLDAPQFLKAVCTELEKACEQ